ncbi:MAG TPA: GAF domain-containing protein [Candidatus Udaeobacter sp.]|nr:GAF domain-containing protein [Candidatus Udaeobacter sp.]
MVPLTLNNVPVAVVVYDADGRVTEANLAAYDLLRSSPSELIGSNTESADWLVVDADERAMAVHPALAALRAAQPVRGVLTRVRRSDGVDIWLQVDAVPNLDGNGVATSATLSLTDVTYLVTRSRATRRSAGDHIIEQVTERLAHARMEPRAILDTVTRALTELRPGLWLASLMGKDPNDIQVVLASSDDSTAVDYAEGYMESMRAAGVLNATPLSSRVIESGEPLVIADISVADLMGQLTDEVRAYMTVHPWLSESRHVGIAIVPMRTRGATIGALLLVESRGSNPLTEKDAVWMQAIADRTGLAVENAQLLEDAVRRLERLAALQSVSLAVSASPDLTLTLKVIVDHVTAQLKVDAVQVLLLDETDNTLTIAASSGFHATAVADYKLPVDEGLPGRVLTSRRIETVTALSAFSQFRRRSLFAREGFRAYGAVPLMSRGKLLGALEVFHRSPLSPDQEWVAFLDALGSVAAVAIDSAQLHERLRYLRPAPAIRTGGRSMPDMSKSEREIMRLAVQGLTNREIADQVHLSQNTIKFHMRQIFQKTGASNRTELAHEAAQEGWV